MTVIVLFYFVFAIFSTIVYCNHFLNRGLSTSFKDSLNTSGLPVIAFTSNGINLNFLIDTGSNASYINKDSLKNIKYDTIYGAIDIVTGLGNTTASIVSFPITYKGLTFTSQFGVMDLSNEFKQIEEESDVKIDGILGTEVLVKNNCVIDFKDLLIYCR